MLIFIHPLTPPMWPLLKMTYRRATILQKQWALKLGLQEPHVRLKSYFRVSWNLTPPSMYSTINFMEMRITVIQCDAFLISLF